MHFTLKHTHTFTLKINKKEEEEAYDYSTHYQFILLQKILEAKEIDGFINTLYQ